MGARFASLFECSLNFQSASHLNRQCIHSGRMSQCYTSWSLCSIASCATLTENMFFAEGFAEVDVVFLFVNQRGETFNYSSFRTGSGERIRVLSSVQSTNCASLPRMTPTCLVLNVRSLVKKFAREELRELMSNSIDHCCLSEAWLRSDSDSLLVTPDGYLMLRKDRAIRRGGEVAILRRKDWKRR